MKLTVSVSYHPQEFLHSSHTLTQPHWTAETFDVPGTSTVYGIDTTSKGAIDDLIGQLKAKGLSGKLKIVRIHTDDQQEGMDKLAEQALENDPVYQDYWA